MIDSIQDVPGAFIGLGWRAFGLLLAVAAVVIAALSLLFFAVTTESFSWLTVPALVGALFGIVVAVIAVFSIRRAFGSLGEYFNSEKTRLSDLSAAVVKERTHPTADAPSRAVKSPYPPAMPAIQTSSTNQANSDFTLALNMFAATLAAMSKEKDGEKVTDKPFSYDKMHEAKYVSRWEDWSRVLDLWEAAELVEKPRTARAWKLLVTNVGDAEQRLSGLYAHNGLIRINGIWMKS